MDLEAENIEYVSVDTALDFQVLGQGFRGR